MYLCSVQQHNAQFEIKYIAIHVYIVRNNNDYRHHVHTFNVFVLAACSHARASYTHMRAFAFSNRRKVFSNFTLIMNDWKYLSPTKQYILYLRLNVLVYYNFMVNFSLLLPRHRVIRQTLAPACYSVLLLYIPEKRSCRI